MFDWFANMFKGAGGGAVDPEAGIPANVGDSIPLGRSQGANEGTGESARQQYQKIGKALNQASAVQANLIQSGLNAGFDNNWLAENSTLGSAMGQKI